MYFADERPGDDDDDEDDMVPYVVEQYNFAGAHGYGSGPGHGCSCRLQASGFFSSSNIAVPPHQLMPMP